MIYRTCLLLCMGLLVSGCARSHYYVTTDNTVTMYLKKTGASEVLFYSSLDRFQPHRAEHMPGDMWRVIVPDCDEIRYFYKIDGKMVLPDCQLQEKDDFGFKNCLYVKGM